MDIQISSLYRKPAPSAAPASSAGGSAAFPPGLWLRSAARQFFSPQPACATSSTGQASRPQWQPPSCTLNLQGSGVDPFGPEPETSAFHRALCSEDYSSAEKMLNDARSANNGALPDLSPYLQFALDNNEAAAVSWLLQFSLQQRLDMPFEVLREAIETSNVRRIELLVGHPRLSDAFANHEVERSILHYAIRKGSADTVGLLLSRQSGRKRAAYLCTAGGLLGFNALHFAVARGDPAKLQAILRFHAQAKLGKDALDANTLDGRSPLALALGAKQFDLATLLLESGAQPLASVKGTAH